MKVQILSDIHNEFTELPLPHTDADVVVLAGDIDLKCMTIDWAKQFKQPVIYILGNHEFYKSSIHKIKRETRRLAENSNIHFLDDEEATIQGVRFIGSTLWTDYRLFGESQQKECAIASEAGMNDYQAIRVEPSNRRLLTCDTIDYHNKSVAFLKQKIQEPFDGKTIVVTHHAPSIRSIHSIYLNDRLTPAFASDMESLMGPPISLWIHGHVHHSNDYIVNGTRVISNPRGYHFKGESKPENSSFNPTFTAEV